MTTINTFEFVQLLVMMEHRLEGLGSMLTMSKKANYRREQRDLHLVFLSAWKGENGKEDRIL